MDALEGLTTLFSKSMFSVGETKVTPVVLLLSLVSIIAIWWVAGAMERSLLKTVRRQGSVSTPTQVARLHLLSRLIRYTVWILGTVVVLNHVGIDLTSIALVGSAMAFGLGFGLQNIFSNFISGIIILLEGSMRVGDFVDLESGVRGNVKDIAMRYTRVTTNDEIDVLVPNSEFINGRVVNWTFDASWRRIHVPFGVAYGTKKEDVREAAIAAAMRVDGVMTEPGHEPTVWLMAYGDSSMNYELIVWANRKLTTAPGSTHAKLMWALDDELQARGIEIPFPQRDLHVRGGHLEVRIEAERGESPDSKITGYKP